MGSAEAKDAAGVGTCWGGAWGGCGSSRDELRGATAQPTGPNTPSIAASKKTISERPGADVHSLACLLYSH